MPRPKRALWNRVPKSRSTVNGMRRALSSGAGAAFMPVSARGR